MSIVHKDKLVEENGKQHRKSSKTKNELFREQFIMPLKVNRKVSLHDPSNPENVVMKNNVMLGLMLQKGRKKRGWKLRELSARTTIDQTLMSRFERGDRLPSAVQLEQIAEELNLNFDDLKVQLMAEKVVKIIEYTPRASEILAVAESRVEYLRGGEREDTVPMSAEIKSELSEVDQLMEEWNSYSILNQTQLKKMKEYFDVSYTYESNRIEGNTLTLQETAMVMNEGLTIGGKSMREHLEVVNHSEAIGFVRGLIEGKEKLTKRSVLEVHRLILKGIDKENAGVYRKLPVKISGSKHEPPQPFLLDKLMEDFFYHFRRFEGQLHLVILAAEMHERLVNIHSFIDGNGRTGRLLMNFILLSNGYTRANIKGDSSSRWAYYKALEDVQINNDPEPFHLLVISEVKCSLKEHLELV